VCKEKDMEEIEPKPMDLVVATTKPRKKHRCRGFKRELGKLIAHKFCLVCGDDNYKALTVDHIVPRVAGGAKRAPENLCFLCRTCNSHKGDRDPVQWLQKLLQGAFPKSPREDLLELLKGTIEAARGFHELATKLVPSEAVAV
jgi:5-methylcytosine-specific restriction endonuclease McrA